MPHILKRLAMSVLFIGALAIFSASPATATPQHRGVFVQYKAVKHVSKGHKQDDLCREASGVRANVIKQFGKRAPGRDICRYGLNDGKSPSRQAETNYLQTLKRMIAPPPPRYVPSTATTSTTSSGSTTYSSSVGTGSLPACASESGTNYSTGPLNTNPSSGATGRYQITPGTAANYGCSLATPAGQDACAQVIYQHQGASAWTNCGG